MVENKNRIFFKKNNLWLSGLDHFLFFHIWGIIIPTDELIFFRGVGQPPTRSYYSICLDEIPCVDVDITVERLVKTRRKPKTPRLTVGVCHEALLEAQIYSPYAPWCWNIYQHLP